MVVGSRVLVRCMLDKYRRDGSTKASSRLAHINAEVVHATSSIDMSVAINSVRGQVSVASQTCGSSLVKNKFM